MYNNRSAKLNLNLSEDLNFGTISMVFHIKKKLSHYKNNII